MENAQNVFLRQLFHLIFVHRSRHVRPIAQLLICLRLYALGSMQISIADFAGVCTATVCNILPRVTCAIAAQRRNFVKMPQTEAEMVAASEAFYKFARFPRTIGAIDCTHIKIQSPGGDAAENYRNRKGWFSFNVQAVCSADMKIINIVTRWPGSSHDQTVFNNSNVKMQLERGDYRNFIIIGDSGYRNTRYLATPYIVAPSDLHNVYNESHIRTRNVIERTFGVIKRRFPVLSLGMRVKLRTVKMIIVACAVLHNIAVDEKELVPEINLEGFEEMLAATEVPDENNNEPNDQNNVRDLVLLNYFRTLQPGNANVNE